MKTLKDHIDEALKIGKNLSSFSTYSCQPKTKQELEKIINNRIAEEGPECNLNDIDVSLIEDMSSVFYRSSFNGDISKWNTSKVTNMMGMFASSEFNGDISKWNVSKVKNMAHMFARSDFNQPIGNWNVNNVDSMKGMFYETKFNQDISKWKISKDCDISEMFARCSIKDEYKPKLPK